MINRCYLEITNFCNLDCFFCPKNKRKPHKLTLEEFNILTDKLIDKIQFLYFHLMGEPLLNENIYDFINIANEKNFQPILTTNGTLINDKLIDAPLYKINISIHSFEGNGFDNPKEYIDKIMRFVLKAKENTIIILRLWNSGGKDSKNEEILKLIEEYVKAPWTLRGDGYKLADNLFIEWDNKFEWPDEENAELDNNVFCYGLRNQIGILVDGTVVPCCLDHEGSIALGNLFDQSLDEILNSNRAKKIYEGFSKHQAIEKLCKTCGYAINTKKYRE